MSKLKFFAVAGVLALAVGVAGVASAQTSDAQLQAQIQSLQAMIQTLQARLAGQPAAASAAFTRDLTIGSTGADVTALQTWLESKGFLVMPAGTAKGYFGALTQAALAKYQVSAGIAPAAGYFGPATRAKVNAEGAGSSTGSTTGSTDTSSLSGGAGDITVTERSAGTEDQVMEGDEEAKVLGFDVEADGSDIAVTSVKVSFEMTGSGSTRLNRYVDEVQIMQGTKVVGSADVDEFSKDNDIYSRSIPVTSVVKDGDKDRFYVAVTASSNIDSDDLSKNWNVDLDQIRFKDGTGAILTDSISSTIDADFSFEDLSTAGDVKLTVNEDDDSVNNAHTVQVDSTSDTNDVELLSFTVKAKGSDETLKTMTIYATSTGAGVTEIANDFRLLMDGTEVGTVDLDGSSFASSTNTTRTITISNLDDDDAVVGEDEEVAFTLVADINDVDGAFGNGDSIVVGLSSKDIVAEDSNGDNLASGDKTGSASSDGTSFGSTGIMISTGDADTSDTVLTGDDTTTNDQGKFTINFTVKAFEDTAYIALTTASSTAAAGSGGAYYQVETSANAAVTTGTTTATLEIVSGGSQTGNYLKINDGQEAKLRLTVYYDAPSTGTYRAQLYAVNFATSATTGDTQELAAPAEDYQSPSELVQN